MKRDVPPPPPESTLETDAAVDYLVQLDESVDLSDCTELKEALQEESRDGGGDVFKAVTSLELLNRLRESDPQCVMDLAYGYDSTDPDGDMPSRIGRFEIKRRLGMGGFGVVFLAHDPLIDREVALKVPRVEALMNERTRGRFVRESRSAAMVAHPHVATIFEAGTVGPVAYIVSEYCRGGSASAFLDRLPGGRLPPRAAAELIARVADAVECAHQQGILHRDIKPTNLLFDVSESQLPWLVSHPEELAEYVRLVDFGLAKDLNSSDPLTRTGMLIGTPAYTAPEQISETRELDATADVYSLGATLYHLLTGTPPLQKATDFATLMANQQEDPVCPRVHSAEVPRDLSAICIKCLEKQSHRRYSTASALAEDLRRFLAGQPVTARQILPPHRWWRAIQRNQLITTLALISLLSIGIAITTVFASLRLIEEQKINARELINRIQAANQRRYEKALLSAEPNPVPVERQADASSTEPPAAEPPSRSPSPPSETIP